MSDRKGFINEFRQFATKGNVIDLAVGVIIGGAFATITKSLTDDIIMPIISLFLGGINFSEWKIVLRKAVLDAGGNELTAAVTINYGNFISTVINFLILALVIFCLVKAINRVRDEAEERNRRAEAQAIASAPAPVTEVKPTTEELLADILMELKNK